jgi:hypothetical protein
VGLRQSSSVKSACEHSFWKLAQGSRAASVMVLRQRILCANSIRTSPGDSIFKSGTRSIGKRTLGCSWTTDATPTPRRRTNLSAGFGAVKWEAAPICGAASCCAYQITNSRRRAATELARIGRLVTPISIPIIACLRPFSVHTVSATGWRSCRTARSLPQVRCRLASVSSNTSSKAGFQIAASSYRAGSERTGSLLQASGSRGAQASRQV